jgi:hypothetical protein
MKRILTLFVAPILFTCPFIFPTASYVQEKSPNLEVYFSPHGGCTDAIIRELNKAKITILVHAYSFTSAPIAKALLNAHKRGVKVEVILDKSQRTHKYSETDFLVNSGIRTYIDAAHTVGRITGESLMEKYYSAIWQRIKQNWPPPQSELKNMKGLETIIQVKIGREGMLKDMWYEKRSGNTVYDQGVWEAIKKSEPFAPIPKEIKEDVLEIGIRFHPD